MKLPVEFINRMHELLGQEESNSFFASLQNSAPVSIRLNPNKINKSQLSAFNLQLKKVPWCSDGYYLDNRLTFTFDPLFHAGVYYVQEASSMFLEQLVRQFVDLPVLALDLCAAPGGKSTHLRSLLPDGSLLVANEVIRNRSNILAENLTKWGHPDVMVTNNDPSDFTKTGVQFDFILADVPCSGEGMFRKDEAAIGEWSTANVDICRRRQRRIISDIWPSLKPGGILIYSTCTYNTHENEDNIHWIASELGAGLLEPDIPKDWNVVGDITGRNLPVSRFFPHRVRGEGFFVAVLRKNGDMAEDYFVPPASANKKSRKVQPETSYTVPPAYYPGEQQRLAAKLRVLQNGIITGSLKGKDLIPSHALAMSVMPQSGGTYNYQEVSYEQAISYLRRESIALPANIPTGYVLITYKNVPLGFVKNIGNRANNLYPSEWRIRSGYLPGDIRVLSNE